MTTLPLIIYKQFYNYISIKKLNGFQWFALQPSYGKNYGNIQKTYIFKQAPKLLDIGNAEIRSMIKNAIIPYNEKIKLLSDPDEQYSGGKSNLQYHEIVKTYFGDVYHGTIIDATNLSGNSEYSKEDLEGASEVVIWKDFTKLLKVIPNNSSKKYITKQQQQQQQNSKIKRNSKSKSKRISAVKHGSLKSKKKRL